MVITSFWDIVNKPFSMIVKGVTAAGRSTLFMTTVGMIFMGCACICRHLFTVDSKFYYYVAGFLCSWGILLERKSKRAEFGLYVFPKALDSIYRQFLQRKFIIDIPGGSILIFCASIAALMYFREFEPTTLPSLLRRVFDFVLPNKSNQVRKKQDRKVGEEN